MVASIAFVIFTFSLSANRLSLGRFQLDGHNHQVLVHQNVPMQIINLLEQWLDLVSRAAVNQGVAMALCNLLQYAFRFISPLNGNNGDLPENLAIMVIDGSLSLGDNLSAASNEFIRRGIILVVFGVTAPIYEVWNYYRTLAYNTGSEYALLQNARGILESVILSAINGEDTLRQAFRHVHVDNVPVTANDVDDMNEQDQTTDGVGDLPFDHGLSE